MADSDVAVANMALTMVGANAITALTDKTDSARAVRRFYAARLDARLRAHDWNFARRRVSLAQLQDVPVFGYDRMFQLPQDPFCLRVLETNLEANEKWIIETYATVSSTYRVLLTDAASVDLVYIARITDTMLWDACFADAFAAELAFLISYPLTRNATLRQGLAADATAAWRVARSVDGEESRALRAILSTSLTSVR